MGSLLCKNEGRESAFFMREVLTLIDAGSGSASLSAHTRRVCKSGALEAGAVHSRHFHEKRAGRGGIITYFTAFID
jgi:hypothetical protein